MAGWARRPGLDFTRGGTHSGQRHRRRPRPRPHRRGRGGVRRAPLGGRGRAEGPLPVPRREDALVHRAREPRHLPLLRLRRARRRDRVPAEDRGHRVRRGRRAARRPGGRAAHLRGRRDGPPARPGHQDPPAGGQQAGRRVLRRAAAHPGGRRPRWRSSPRAASTRPRPSASAAATPPRAGTRSPSTCSPAGSPSRSWRRPGSAGRATAARWTASTAAAVADPRPRRRGRRLRGAAPLRRRPHRGEVPQHRRDAGLPQDARAVRARPGQVRDRQAAPGRGRRGLHRRHGDAPRRACRRPSRRAAPRSAPSTSA